MTDIAFCCRQVFHQRRHRIDRRLCWPTVQMATRGGPGLRWRLLSADGGPVAASSQRLAADGSLPSCALAR